MKRALAERAKAQRVEANRAAAPVPTPSLSISSSIPKDVRVGAGDGDGDGVRNGGGGGGGHGVGIGGGFAESTSKPARKIQRVKSPRSSPTKQMGSSVAPPQSQLAGPSSANKRVRNSKNSSVVSSSSIPVETTSTAPTNAIHTTGESIIARVVNRGPSSKPNTSNAKVFTKIEANDTKHRTPSSSIDSSNLSKSPTTSSKKRNSHGSSSTSKRSRKSSSSKKNNDTNSSNNATSSALPLHPIHSDDDETTHSTASGDQQSSNGSGFYLKHQNRALISELHAMKHSIRNLEGEREVRRRECLSIGEALRRLETFWREMEVVVFGGLMKWKLRDMGPRKRTCIPVKKSNNIAPSSTGKGTDVETIGTILDALTTLGHSSILPPLISKNTGSDGERDESMIPEESCQKKLKEEADAGGADGLQNGGEVDRGEDDYQIYLKSLSDATTSFSDRCSQFQQLLVDLVQHMWSSSITQGDCDDNCSQEQEDIFHVATLHKQIATLQTTCSKLEDQVTELVKARDDANISERRVRKGLYRLASGRMKIGDVLKTVEKEGSSSLDLDDTKKKALPQTVESSSVKLDASVVAPGEEVATTIKVDGRIVGNEDVLKMKKKNVELGLVAELREKKITELLKKKESCEKRINDLLAKEASLKVRRGNKISDEDAKLSAPYIGVSSKLSASEREVQRLKKDLISVKTRWGVTKGDLELARKNVTVLTEKHYRRLRELAGEPDADVVDELYDNTSAAATNGDKQYIQNAKKSIELEHKLKHALDSVRQADAIRASLTESNLLNEELQNKLEELRLKNSLLLATKVEARTKSADSYSVSSNTSSKQSREASNHRDPQLRLVKKQLLAATNSKEQAKTKQERAEKERDVLMKTNARLIKQIQEKDDMNAKSLSTILHLKQLSEQLVEEKNILEKKLKGTQQLEIAARLAANAKERVEEEATREMETYQDEVKEVKVSLESSIIEKEEFSRLLAESKAQVVAVTDELNIIRNRCDELVYSSTINEKEKKKLNEALAIAKNEADETNKKAKRGTCDSASPSGRGKGSKFENKFSNEDLSKLVTVLKDRLTCPVCNTRDKEVILLRCRHMFCRQCVDINIKNRSRKCPACAQRFDVKDVEDVWL